jgi:hypothetical protein
LLDGSGWLIYQYMNAVVLKAHFDGESVCLDEPYPLRPDMKLLVTVVPEGSVEDERGAWLAASQAAFARGYGEDEPDYSSVELREQPPGK